MKTAVKNIPGAPPLSFLQECSDKSCRVSVHGLATPVVTFSRIIRHRIRQFPRMLRIGMFSFAWFLIAVVPFATTSPIRSCKSISEYEGYKVVVVYVLRHDEALAILETLSEEGRIEILSRSGHKDFVLGYKVDILISPEHLEEVGEVFVNQFDKTMNILGIIPLGSESPTRSYLEVIKMSGTTNQDPESFDYKAYHTLDSIYDYLDLLARIYPSFMEVFELEGSTYEGRRIKAIRITNDIRNETSREKPLVWLNGGTHSREWISPATVMYIADALSGDLEPERGAEVAALRDTFQFVIAPIINPDGYEYTRINRYWRKNRKPSGCRFNLESCTGECIVEECYGVDTNRNWDVHFGVLGSSTDPCDYSYPGERAFDQECVQIVRDYLIQQSSVLKVHIDYHSYAQLFLYPWGHTREEPEHQDYYSRVGAAYVEAIKQTTGKTYLSHRIVEIHQQKYPDKWYDVSGSSIDWVYKTFGVVDSYGIELRDQGEEDFDLSTDQILPSGQESFAGLIAILDIISED